MCFGRILVPNKTLDSYGIRSGTTVFVLNKISLCFDNLTNKSINTNNSNNEKTNKGKALHSDIHHMVIALRTALMNASFRNILDKLSESESRENLMAVTPGLREDPITFGLFSN